MATLGTMPETMPADQPAADPGLSPVNDTSDEMASQETESGLGSGSRSDPEPIDEEIPQILPKGIVENHVQVYVEVASHQKVPIERLIAYWKVYTTTHRKLIDPTARRLEHFWWHVWGSDRRNLSGPALARMYEKISNGPTDVPLRGPPNRYEGPETPFTLPFTMNKVPVSKEIENTSSENSDTPAKKAAEERPASLSTSPISETPAGHEAATAEDEKSENAQVGGSAEMRRLPSSSARPAPSQSILKKPRPSLSGPRPTTHFALPSGETSEEDKKISVKPNRSAGHVASTSSSASHGDRHHSDTSDNHSSSHTRKTKSSKSGARKPKVKLAKKKFVVNSSASKRKAVVSKRSGSHSASSVGSYTAPAPHEALLQQASPLEEEEMEEGVLRMSPPLSQHADGTAAQSIPAPSPQQGTASSKSAGKQPAYFSGSLQHEQMASPASTSTAASETSSARTAAVPASAAVSRRPALVQQASGHSASSGSVTSEPAMLEMPITYRNRATASQPAGRDGRPTVGRGAATTGTASSGYPPSASRRHAFESGGHLPIRMVRSLSHDSYAPSFGIGGSRASLAQGIGSPAITAPSMVAATGVFSETEAPDPFEVYARTAGLDNEDSDGPALATSPVEGTSYNEHSTHHRLQFTPTRPSPTPRIPFARTRSQLNIILDRERERLGQGNFASWRESRRDHGSHGSHGGEHNGDDRRTER